MSLTLVGAGGRRIATHLVLDRFTDADDTKLTAGGHLPDDAAGFTWSSLSGSVEIQSSAVWSSGAGQSVSAVDVSLADIKMQADFTRKTDNDATNATWGLALRAAGGVDFFEVRYQLNSVLELQVYSWVGGGPTLQTSTAYTWSTGATHTMAVTANGNDMELFVDGVSKLVWSTNTMAANTQHGISFFSGSSDYADNFRIQTLAQAQLL